LDFVFQVNIVNDEKPTEEHELVSTPLLYDDKLRFIPSIIPASQFFVLKVADSPNWEMKYM
jgi:hypothetical protein